MNCSENFEYEIEILIRCYTWEKKKQLHNLWGEKILKQVSAKKEEDM